MFGAAFGGGSFGAPGGADGATLGFSLSIASTHVIGTQSVTATGTQTAWGGSNPFSITVGGAFASISNYVNISATSATFDLTITSLDGAVTIADSNSGTTQDISAVLSVPGAPTVGTVTNNGNGTATVPFTDNPDNGGAPVTSRVAIGSLGDNGTWVSDFTIIVTVDPSRLELPQTWVVRCTNSVGQGPASAASNAVAVSGALMAGWSYRKTHAIAGSEDGNLTNYQMDIVAHRATGTDAGADVFLGTNCRPDFGDVRFTTPAGTLIPYHCVSGNKPLLQSSVFAPSSSYKVSTSSAIGNLTGAAGLEMVIGWGSALNESPVFGTVRAYNAAGTVLWNFDTPSTDYIMGLAIGDVRNTGSNQVAVCGRLINQTVYLLDGATGATLGSYANATDGTTYLRGCAIGKVTADAGNQLVIADSNGWVTVLKWNGSALAVAARLRKRPGNTGQVLHLADVDGDGFDEIIISWGNHTTGSCYTSIYNGDLSLLAEYQHTGKANSYGSYPAYGLDPANPTQWCIAYTAQSLSYDGGVMGVLRLSGATLVSVWEKQVGYYKDPLGPSPITVCDIDHDGSLEVIASTGYGASGATFPPPYGHGCLYITDLAGNWKYTVTTPSTAARLTLGDINGDGFDEVLVTTNQAEAQIFGSMDSSEARFTLNIPSIPTGGTAVYVYYGNAAATSASDPAATHILYDDLSSTTGWSLSVSGSGLFKPQEMGYYTEKGASVFAEAGEVRIAAKRSPTLTSPRRVRVFLSNDESDVVGVNSLLVSNSARSDQSLSLAINSAVSTANYTSGTDLDTGVARVENGWVMLELRIGPTTSYMHINGVQVDTSTTLTTANANFIELFGSGTAGPGTMNGVFSQLTVDNYTPNEPTHGAWEPEESDGSPPLTVAVAATGSVTYTGTAAVVATIFSGSAVTATVAATGSITYTGTAAVVASVVDTPTSTEPVTLAEAKQAARISDTSDFDEMIPGLITAARQIAEQETGRELVRKTRRSTFADWPAADLVLPVYAAESAAISYWGPSGWTALDSGAFAFYELGTGTGIAPAIGGSWPALAPVAGGPRVRVDVTAGPTDPTTAEACIKQYIKALVAWWIENPGAVAQGNMQPAPYLRNLLDPVRLWA